MATINTSSVWSTLIIAMNRWEFMHVWMIIVHICMNSHLFIAMINVDQADDMLIVAMKDCWSFMITYIIMSSWNISWPLLHTEPSPGLKNVTWPELETSSAAFCLALTMAPLPIISSGHKIPLFDPSLKDSGANYQIRGSFQILAMAGCCRRARCRW